MTDTVLNTVELKNAEATAVVGDKQINVKVENKDEAKAKEVLPA